MMGDERLHLGIIWQFSLYQLKHGRLTQAELATKIGVKPSVVSRLMNDKVSNISLKILYRLCKLFDCEPNDLLTMPTEKD